MFISLSKPVSICYQQSYFDFAQLNLHLYGWGLWPFAFSSRDQYCSSMFHHKSSLPLSPVDFDLFVFHQIPLSGIYLVQPQPVYVDQRPDVKTKPPFLTAVVGAGRHRTPLYMVDTICFSEAVTKQLSGFSWSI